MRINVIITFSPEAIEYAREKKRDDESMGECLLRLWWAREIRAEDSEVLE
jgi:hypothetical protein